MIVICACTRNQIMRIKWYGNRKWFSFSIWLWLCVLLMLCWDRAHTYRHEWIGMLYAVCNKSDWIEAGVSQSVQTTHRTSAISLLWQVNQISFPNAFISRTAHNKWINIYVYWLCDFLAYQIETKPPKLVTTTTKNNKISDSVLFAICIGKNAN